MKGDFAVVLQPGLEGLELPDYNNNGDKGVLGSSFRDLSYLAPNCVYPAQKLQARSEYERVLSNGLLILQLRVSQLYSRCGIHRTLAKLTVFRSMSTVQG